MISKNPTDLIINTHRKRKLFEDEPTLILMDESIEAGDHISSPRTMYSHHGIYVGNGKVIHYSGFVDGISSGKIEHTNLENFSRNNSIFINRHKYRKYTGSEIVTRAYQRLGEDWYNVLLNNCEHFAYWCIMGWHKSPQVNNILASIRIAAELATDSDLSTPKLPSLPKPYPKKEIITEVKTFTSFTPPSLSNPIALVIDLINLFSKKLFDNFVSP